MGRVAWTNDKAETRILISGEVSRADPRGPDWFKKKKNLSMATIESKEHDLTFQFWKEFCTPTRFKTQKWSDHSQIHNC